MHATHDFFHNERYLHLDPNIITVNECEGGAGVFTVSEHNLTKLSKYDPTTDHFCQLAYLTVSSQLQLEAISCALGPVYTVNKSFRSEHSNTVKHLSEFSHLEIENTFIDLDYLMNISEKYIRFIIDYVLTHHKGDIDNLSNFVSKGLTDRLVKFQQTNFQRVTYSDAIDIVGGKWGEDLSSEMEQRLTAHFGCPVFVSHWPFEIKSFYMKRDTNNPLLCHNFDLIMPGKVGELIGGSMREENLDQLKDAMKTKGVSEIPLQFYLDLRKFGTAPHGGFGLGLERLIMFVTGMENIKDVVPFPVYYKNCKY
jgi:asparaginyl-tRNA synthetase